MAIGRALQLVPVAALLVAQLGLAHAACDAIPSARQTFRSTTASVDRPFAKPGDWVEIEIDEKCHGAERFPDAAADYVVTIAFVPPADFVAGTEPVARVVALAKRPPEIQAQVDACRARPDVASVTALRVNRPDRPKDVERRDERTLAFRFPDTDALLGAPDDDRTLSGPVRIAVTRAGEPLPCELASRGCGAVSGALACIDELFADDGSCNPVVNETFARFTALPPPNAYHALCTDPIPPCDPTPTRNVGYALDFDGNVLVPMDWGGILVKADAVPVPRLLRGTATITAFPDSDAPLRLPDRRALSSYAPNGAKLPPFFEPRIDPSNEDGLTLFGTADAPQTVLRIARRSGACASGERAGSYCSTTTDCGGEPCLSTCLDEPSVQCQADADCASGHCGALFDLASVAAVAEPLTTAAQGLVALDPVSLDGLVQTETMNAFVRSEALAARDTDGDGTPDAGDLNGDGDMTDNVLTIGDRATGAARPIGVGGAPGRAIARVWQPPFSSPALEVADDLIAFLEPETLQFGLDANRNGRVFETLLRVFRSDGTELTAGIDPPIAVDAAPVIDGRSVRVSGGRVFFRSALKDRLPQKVSRVSVDSNMNEGNGDSSWPSLSGDGRFVAFTSTASNLVPDDHNDSSDVFVHDRQMGTTERISESWDGRDANGGSWDPLVSYDGSIVAFASYASNLVGELPSLRVPLFVHDRRSGRTIQVPLPDGLTGEDARLYALSGDGSTVMFGDTSSGGIHLWSIEDGGLERISVDGPFVAGAMSIDGRIVVVSGFYGVHVVDRRMGTIRHISADWSFDVELSADGRWLAIESIDDTLVPGDTNGSHDVVVVDLLHGSFERVSIRPDGGQFAVSSFLGAISYDGRYVAFENSPNGNDAFVYLHDRATKTSSRRSRLMRNNGSLLNSTLSLDATVLAFTTHESVSDEDRNQCERTWGCSPDVKVARDEICPGILDYATCAHASLSCTKQGDPPYEYCACPYTTGCSDVYVLAADSGATEGGDLKHATLSILEPRGGGALSEVGSCGATAVSIVSGVAAFLHPETARPDATCPGGSLNRNPDTEDTDTDDAVVLFWDGTATVANLGRAARQIAMSETAIVALVSEHDDAETNYNPVTARRSPSGPPAS